MNGNWNWGLVFLGVSFLLGVPAIFADWTMRVPLLLLALFAVYQAIKSG